MHNGDDTAFYLSQGYRVVAIEADPELAARGRVRFAHHIAAGRLTILHIGIADRTGFLPFWICETNAIWNSFDRSLAAREGSPHHCLTIPATTFGSVLKEHGTPYFLKIDIESSDPLCLQHLDPRDLPRFISAEADSPDLESSQKEDEVLGLLFAKGYRKFKLIEQANLSTLAWPPSKLGRLASKLVLSLAYGRLRPLGLSRFTRRFTNRDRLAARNNGYRFPFGSSGPWGEGTLGEWITYEAAREAVSYYRAEHFRTHPRGRQEKTFWCDWHATW